MTKDDAQKAILAAIISTCRVIESSPAPNIEAVGAFLTGCASILGQISYDICYNE